MFREDLARIDVAEIASRSKGGAGVCASRSREHGVAIGRIIHKLIGHRVAHMRRRRPEGVRALIAHIQRAEIEWLVLVQGMRGRDSGLVGRPGR